MSKTAHTDDIDQLVSSVRDFVSHKEPRKSRLLAQEDRLVLTPDQRVIDLEMIETPAFVGADGVEGSDNVLSIDSGQPTERAGLEATIAELEAAVIAQSDDWEPDEGESFEQHAWAVSAFQMAQADSEVEPVTEQEMPASHTDEQITAVPASPARDTDDDENLMAIDFKTAIDEDALRALVLEVVQDELGGALGERITRNVRKLVRREINRVLTSREMGQD